MSTALNVLKRVSAARQGAVVLVAALLFLLCGTLGVHAGRVPFSSIRGIRSEPVTPSCFEESCNASPFIMIPSRTANGSQPATTLKCFKFVTIGCYASPKGCCPAVARRFTGVSFDTSGCGLWRPTAWGTQASMSSSISMPERCCGRHNT